LRRFFSAEAAAAAVSGARGAGGLHRCILVKGPLPLKGRRVQIRSQPDRADGFAQSKAVRSRGHIRGDVGGKRTARGQTARQDRRVFLGGAGVTAHPIHRLSSHRSCANERHRHHEDEKIAGLHELLPDNTASGQLFQTLQPKLRLTSSVRPATSQYTQDITNRPIIQRIALRVKIVNRLTYSLRFHNCCAGRGTRQRGFAGDGGLAAAAQLNFPCGLAVGSGKLYIAERSNNLIRRVDLT